MFSHWLRRLHMYAALFLVPWVLIYAVSTAVMNHSSHFSAPPERPVFERVSEQTYNGSFAEGATPRQIGTQLLADLGMQGKHRVRRNRRTGVVTIDRDTPLGPRRITYDPGTRELTVEKGTYSVRMFMAQIHRRRGFDSDSFKEDAYGFFVDAFVITMLFWIFSGVWMWCHMWWQLGGTRRRGWLSIASGFVLFTFFLLAI